MTSYQDAILLLDDGTEFHGKSFGAKGSTTGEVVFNTAMTGYQEIITDPSYDSQIITFTNPHIGNTGINLEDVESRKIYCSGIIIRDIPILSSSWRLTETLENYLVQQGLIAMFGIDTRRLTKILRTKGVQNGCIIAGKDLRIKKAEESLKKFSGLIGKDLAQKVTTKEIYKWENGLTGFQNKKNKKKIKKFHVVTYDFGVKHNILRILADHGCKLTVVPAKFKATEVMKLNPDGVFLSNGPGDPEACSYAIENIQKILEKNIPTFGICLGFQLLALASGAKTIKMKFGHHGANHPVIDLKSKKVFITSQNHGFAVDEKKLPKNLEITHISLFDNSLQGLKRRDIAAFGFQGHPEASPGPHDINEMFIRFIAMMETKKKNAKR
ncbi:MAG: glutamine-hydrolyzing carbamoyl-phosphate synthase small subunit [Pseudomonadota bacterium]|nr:glutamine-hydrolyzing carbamoyl-phosphate synthase small subunit [Pseudomonadota bacterium]